MDGGRSQERSETTTVRVMPLGGRRIGSFRVCSVCLSVVGCRPGSVAVSWLGAPVRAVVHDVSALSAWVSLVLTHRSHPSHSLWVRQICSQPF